MKADAMWRRELTDEQYRVLRERGTELPFSGEYVHHHEDGVYRCVACGADLFPSTKKFDSGTGWPSFSDVMREGNVTLTDDTSHGMRRTEVTCTACGGHLGHVFDDGPQQMPDGSLGTGKRYCINSVCLAFEPNNL